VINGGIREGLAGDDSKKAQRLKHDVQPARDLVDHVLLGGVALKKIVPIDG
jgi:hypothetical protein